MEPSVLFSSGKLFSSLSVGSLSLDSVRGLVEEMKAKLGEMKIFLINADRKRGDGDTNVSDLMMEGGELTYDAEEVIATFLVEVERAGRTGCLPELSFGCLPTPRQMIVSQIQQINNRFAAVSRNFLTYGVRPVSMGVKELTTSFSTMGVEDAVGLRDHIAALVTHLKDGNHCRIITIWGIGGVGKTTLSKMIRRQREIRRFFDHIAFVSVSEQLHPTQVWRNVLFQFANSEEQMKRARKLPESELEKELHSLQRQKKCLVILDDIWEKRNWNELRSAFPPTTTTGSKILLTTRNKAVLSRDDDDHDDDNMEVLLYELRPLTYDDSLELLKQKAFPLGEENEMTTEIKEVMEEIVRRCGGLPLAIALVGGLLAKDKSIAWWQKVCQHLSNSDNEGVHHVLVMSYQNLPYNLKACFLYLSLFPEDCEIEVKSLVQMWIAEGFISSTGREGGRRMLDVGLSYLEELVNRSMVEANHTGLIKRVRYCRLHDLVRDFCLLKAQEKNFSKDLRLRHSVPSTPTSGMFIRRLAVYFDVSEQRPVSITPLQGGHHVLSCLVHPPGDHANVSLDTMNSLLKGFRFLKVFNLEHSGSTDHGKLSKDIGKLVHLRYLKLALSSLRLPSSLGNLIFLQTLDLRGIECRIPNVLWKLKELTHLYLPRYCLHPIKLRLDGLSKLETLVNFHTDFCDIGSLVNLPNLQKLCISCRVDELAMIFAFPMFSGTDSLLQRSTFNIDGAAITQDEHHNLTRVLACPRLFKFTLNGLVYAETSFLDVLNTGITSITLTGCQLNEDPMPVLGKMPNLRKLTLRRDSYIGEKMVCLAPESSSGAGGFPQLTLLWLKGLDISEWEVEEGTMRCLSTLGIYGCKKLKEIPQGLKSITSLERLHFGELKASFKRRIVQGGKDFQKVEHVPFIIITD